MSNNLTLASKVRDTILSGGVECFSLYAGYGMKAGQYVRFPQGVQIQEKRNTKGRCIKAAYQYADGSKLTYTYHAISESYKLTAN